MTDKISVREAAYLCLLRCESGNKFSNIELDHAIEKYGFAGYDRGFFTTLVYGVIERRITLDHVISCYSKTPLHKMENKVLHILRLGAYQILFLDRTPDSAACNESVELAKKHTHKGTAGFVNGVLRNIARNKNSYPMPDGADEYLSVKYSCPVWLIQLWEEQYGKNKAEKILQAINVFPKLTLRVNTLKTSREEFLLSLNEEKISAEKTEISEDGVVLNDYVPISDIKSIQLGLCYVQDEASQICVDTLDAKRGQTVIDTCSCPGGKSFGIAMKMQNEGVIYSFDLHESKLSLIDKGASRLGITIIRTEAHNGASPKAELIGKADRVLCDVPCSGLGVIAKKPDLRHKSISDIKRLPEIQYGILKASSEYVKNGGYIVYSTCTLNKDENENVVSKFISENDGFCIEEMKTFFPDEGKNDGFFVCKIKKK